MIMNAFVILSTVSSLFMFALWKRSDALNALVKIFFLIQAVLGILVCVKLFNLLSMVS